MKEIKFRLIKDGKIVGYEKHILRPQCGENRTNVICVCYLAPDEILDPKAYWKCSWYNPNDFIDHDSKEQFIGLKAKNGNRDLYASDKVLIGNDKGVLVWDEDDFCWGLQLDDGEINALCRFYDYKELENITYLGNIHSEKK